MLVLTAIYMLVFIAFVTLIVRVLIDIQPGGNAVRARAESAGIIALAWVIFLLNILIGDSVTAVAIGTASAVASGFMLFIWKTFPQRIENRKYVFIRTYGADDSPLEKTVAQGTTAASPKTIAGHPDLAPIDPDKIS